MPQGGIVNGLLFNGSEAHGFILAEILVAAPPWKLTVTPT
jgi:hypothetical protein